MKRNLLEISDEIRELETYLFETGGELTDDGERDLDEWLDKLGKERDQKLDGYAALITELEGVAEFRKQESKRLAELAAIDQSKANRLKERLLYFFSRHGYKKIETDRYSLMLANNGGKPPLIISSDDIPEEFIKVEIVKTPDINQIRAVLDTGDELPFARYGERGQHLRIK